ncbi:hypothetical protein SAMN04488058_13418 [Deinococcus reticulitermitis]|uniref:Uncharacterized protein n=1 Tax=Deinococcus reticulitermitis TaxID=856736 RepID=A0A1H7CZ02_9DEIO|nr:hypothetical protein SAMN04488058_13418 [Deinococcus reticulitermitis]
MRERVVTASASPEALPNVPLNFSGMVSQMIRVAVRPELPLFLAHEFA